MPHPDPHHSIRSAAAAVISSCNKRSWTVGVAESLTGGMVLANLIAVPGASSAIVGGVVAYHPRLKQSLLDVPSVLVDQHGTVSAQCGRAMAQGARRRLGVVVALATTGVAGPAPSEGHPAGTVHLAVSLKPPGGEELLATSLLSLRGTREEIRTAACLQGLSLLLDTLRSEGPSAPVQVGGVR